MFRSPPKLIHIWSFLLALGLAVPTVSSIGAAPSAAATRPLVIIVMENHERTDMVQSSSAPYLNGLRTRGIDFTNYVGVSHPSLPNYLALASGSTAGKSGTDSISAGQISGMPTVWNQLQSQGIGWRVYEEGMPWTCYGGSSSDAYVLRHNPRSRSRACSGTRSRAITSSRIRPAFRSPP